MSAKAKKGHCLPAKYSELTPQERAAVRVSYVIQQEHKCHYCKALLKHMPEIRVMQMKITPELFPDGFFDYPVHLHHDHRTDLTIGAVHSYCNAVLWEYEGE